MIESIVTVYAAMALLVFATLMTNSRICAKCHFVVKLISVTIISLLWAPLLIKSLIDLK